MKVVGLALLLLSCWSTPRPRPPRSDARIDVTVERAELANGLRVVVVAEPTASEVAITMRYGVGDADDPAGREGLAHLSEHVLFEPVLDRLETDSVAFNGYTTHDSTLYVERATPDKLAAMLAIEGERTRATCDAVTPAAFERQREVVRNELRERGDEDADSLGACHRPCSVPAHPFARVSSATDGPGNHARSRSAQFVAQHYVPSNAVLVVSGRTTLAEVRPLVETAFGQVPRPAMSSGPRIAPPAGPHQVELEAPVDREWVLLAWPMPAQPAPSRPSCVRSRRWPPRSSRRISVAS